MLSTLSKKMLMCLTGLFLAFFLLIHFLGNLQLFLPQEQAHLQFDQDYLLCTLCQHYPSCLRWPCHYIKK